MRFEKGQSGTQHVFLPLCARKFAPDSCVFSCGSLFAWQLRDLRDLTPLCVLRGPCTVSLLKGDMAALEMRKKRLGMEEPKTMQSKL